MQLLKKKKLAAKVLKVGKDRIIFVEGNLTEIKEAITRADITNLYNSGAIIIREVKGRRKIIRKRHRRRTGKIKNKRNNKKKEYVIITKKLRKFAKHLLKTGSINKDKYKNIRKMIKSKGFKSKRHLKEILEEQ